MKIKELKDRELLISLIADYLTNYRLVCGLNDMGMNANTYDIHLGDTIFTLMGFGATPKEELIYERFYEYSQKVMKLDIKHQAEPFNALVNEIYEWLCAERRKYENAK